MVERQLCKLDVRGSNPLASTFALVRKVSNLGKVSNVNNANTIKFASI